MCGGVGGGGGVGVCVCGGGGSGRGCAGVTSTSPKFNLYFLFKKMCNHNMEMP